MVQDSYLLQEQDYIQNGPDTSYSDPFATANQSADLNYGPAYGTGNSGTYESATGPAQTQTDSYGNYYDEGIGTWVSPEGYTLNQDGNWVDPVGGGVYDTQTGQWYDPGLAQQELEQAQYQPPTYQEAGLTGYNSLTGQEQPYVDQYGGVQPAPGTGNQVLSNEVYNQLDYFNDPNQVDVRPGYYDPGTGIIQNPQNLRQQGLASGAISGSYGLGDFNLGLGPLIGNAATDFYNAATNIPALIDPSLQFGYNQRGQPQFTGDINTITTGEVGAIPTPYREEISNALGDVGRLALQYGPYILNPLDYAAQQLGLPTPLGATENARANVGQFAGENIYPQNLAQALPEFIPGIGSIDFIPELAALARTFGREAVRAASEKAAVLGARTVDDLVPTVERLLTEERAAGQLDFGLGGVGKEGEKTFYRGVTSETTGQGLNSGTWITDSPEAAQRYAELAAAEAKMIGKDVTPVVEQVKVNPADLQADFKVTGGTAYRYQPVSEGSQGIEVTWANKNYDLPVTITGHAGKYDGEDYFTIAGSNTMVPLSQLKGDKAALDSLQRMAGREPGAELGQGFTGNRRPGAPESSKAPTGSYDAEAEALKDQRAAEVANYNEKIRPEVQGNKSEFSFLDEPGLNVPSTREEYAINAAKGYTGPVEKPWTTEEILAQGDAARAAERDVSQWTNDKIISEADRLGVRVDRQAIERGLPAARNPEIAKVQEALNAESKAKDAQSLNAASELRRNTDIPPDAQAKLENDLAAPLRGGSYVPPGNYGPPIDLSFLRRDIPGEELDKVTELLRTWDNNQRVVLDSLAQNPSGLANIVNIAENVARGNYADSWINTLLYQTENLRAGLSHIGVDSKTAKQIVDTAIQAKLAERYTDNVKLSQVSEMLKAREKEFQSISKSGAMTLRDRTMNTIFGVLDAGVFGQQALATVREGGLPAVAGLVNRLLGAAHLPAVDVYKGLDQALLGKKALSITDGLYHGIKGSALEPGSGTLLRYVPGLDMIDKYAITPFLDASTNLQFGSIMGTLRQMVYEGNLSMLALKGEDIRNPAIRQAVARNANNITSAAQTALTPGRSAIERVSLISPSMARSRVERVLDMTKLISGNEVERQLAAIQITSNAIFLLGIGKFLNDTFGIYDFVMDPSQYGFGTVTLPNIDSQGRHIQVNLFPQASFERALFRSIDTLARGNTSDLADIWGRFAAGQEGLLLRPITGALGYGYDSQGKFHTGDMGLKEGLISSLPIPPLARLVNSGERNPLRLGLETLGIPTYGQSVFGEKIISGTQAAANTAGLIANGVPQDIAQIIKGMNYLDLGSRNKQDVEALLKPEDVARWTEAERKAHSEYQAAIDQQQAIRDNYAPVFAQFEAMLKDPNVNPYDVKQAIKATDTKMWEDLQKVEFPESKNPREKSDIQNLQEAYRGLYDMAKDANGKVNYDLLGTLQTAFIDDIKKSDPSLGRNLEYNVEKRPDPKDPEILQTLSGLQPLLNEYYSVPPEERTAWRYQNPQEEGLLIAYGQLSTAHTAEAAQFAAALNGGRTPPVNIWLYDSLAVPNNSSVPGYREASAELNNGTWKINENDSQEVRLEKIAARNQWLADNPEKNAALTLGGQVGSVYSMEAYNLVMAGK